MQETAFFILSTDVKPKSFIIEHWNPNITDTVTTPKTSASETFVIFVFSCLKNCSQLRPKYPFCGSLEWWSEVTFVTDSLSDDYQPVVASGTKS